MKARQISKPEAVATLAKRWIEENDRGKTAWDVQVAANLDASTADNTVYACFLDRSHYLTS